MGLWVNLAKASFNFCESKCEMHSAKCTIFIGLIIFAKASAKCTFFSWANYMCEMHIYGGEELLGLYIFAKASAKCTLVGLYILCESK